MFKNYLKIALRNLRKHKGYVFINVTGLAVGMACCLLILLYVQYELSFDRYNEKIGQIYRLCERFVPVQEGGSDFVEVAAPAAWRTALLADFPEILHLVRIYPAPGQRLISYKDKRFYESQVAWADSSLFEVFTLPLVSGNPKTVLAEPGAVVISETTARRYFGDEDPLGKTLAIEGTDCRVTGIMRDMPANSHFQFDLFASMSSLGALDARVQWIYHVFYTYLLLPSGYNPDDLEKKLPGFIEKHLGRELTTQQGSDLRPFLQALADAHLRSAHFNADITPQGDIRYIYIFSTIALFILLIACINFVNLATAQAANRAKEVGMRKVLGAQRTQLIQQFLGESVLLSFAALLTAVVLVELLLPPFNRLSGLPLDTVYHRNIPAALGLFGFTLLVGIGAGSYPALFLSGFQPARVMKGGFSFGAKGEFFRKGLVIFQFVISIVLMIGTSLVHRQLDYIQYKKLGFDKEQVVVIPIQGNTLRERYDVLHNQILHAPGVIAVGAASNLPGRTIPGNMVIPEGHKPRSMRMLFVDHDFPTTLGMEVVAGRNFSKNFPSDDPSAFLLNETAVNEFGWDDPIGKQFAWILPDRVVKSGTVIGVLKDFHIRPLHEKIEPLVLFIWPGRLNNVYARIAPDDVQNTLASLEKVWQIVYPEYPFEYTFLDDEVNRLYQGEQRLAQIFGYFAGLAFLIAGLGLFGLAAFIAEKRTREIGVRKVLGASIAGIVALLSKDFLKLVLVALVVASPLAYFAMNRWLQEFAYRIQIGIETFLLAGVSALAIAWLTVSYQSIKAALGNPVEALRYEWPVISNQ
jgi:putative ABC transport system permease protein